VSGEKGTMKASEPTAEELEIAHQRLGDSGFLAILSCNLTSEYHATVTREISDFAHENGIDTRVYDSNNDSYLQTTKLETARLEGAQAFVICPLDSKTLDSAMKSLDEANYPLVLPATGDTDLGYGGVIINTDNYLLGVIPGRYGGQYIRDNLNGQADVIILDYPDLEHIVQRANGLEDGIKEYAPNVNIVGRYKGGTRDFARESVSKLIAEGTKFNVIASINDAGSYGAIEAMEAANIDPSSVAIFSVDAEQQAQDYINRGYFMQASVPTARTDYAKAAVGLIVRQLAGATLPQIIVLAPGEIVTKKSLEQAKQKGS
jgi:ribose transport system substrate-binding protein